MVARITFFLPIDKKEPDRPSERRGYAPAVRFQSRTCPVLLNLPVHVGILFDLVRLDAPARPAFKKYARPFLHKKARHVTPRLAVCAALLTLNLQL
jgi:hypothetical protein